MKKPALLYAALALVVLWPAFGSGQLFLLDMVWPESIHLISYTQNGPSSSFFIMALLQLLNVFLPVWLLQKLVLLAILTVAGLGMYALHKKLNKLSNFWMLFAGAFYATNPFVLDRLLAGQWLVLAGYAFLPWFAILAYNAHHNPTKRNLTLLVIGWAAYPMLSIHWWYIVTLVLLPIVIYKLIQAYRQHVHTSHSPHPKPHHAASYRHSGPTSSRHSGLDPESSKKRIPNSSRHPELDSGSSKNKNSYSVIPGQTRSPLKKESLFSTGFPIRSGMTNGTPKSPWLLATLLLLGLWIIFLAVRYTRATSSIGSGDFEAFTTRSIDAFGAWGAVLSLRGFWYSSGVIPHALELLWLLACVGLLVSSIYAIRLWHKHHPRQATYTFVVFIVITILAVGYTSPLGERLTDIFRTILPGYSGLREPQKLVGLIAFIYAVAAPIGLQAILRRKPKREAALYIVPAMVGTLVLCLAFAIPTVHAGLKPYRYPADWKAVDTIFYYHQPKRVLILPWNGYIHLPFANDAFVANPAGKYFDARVSARGNSGNKTLDDARGNSTFDTQVLSLKQNSSALTAIRAAGYDYILLIHTEDYLSYKKQLDKAGIQLVHDGRNLSLYNTKQQLLDQSF